MDDFGESDTGVASAMVIVNSAARPLRDVRAATVARAGEDDLAARALEVALGGRDAATVARLAAAVVSPVEPDPPLIEQVRARISKQRGFKKADRTQAAKILEDHVT